VETKELQTALKKLSKIVKSRTTTPILLCVLFHSVNGKLHVTADDYQCGATLPLEAEGFNLAVPFSELNGWVQKVKDLEIELAKDGDSLLASTESSNCKIKGLPAEMFPLVFANCETTPLEGDLKLQLQRALRSAPSSDVKFLALSGINIVSTGESLRIQSADGVQACFISIAAELPVFDIVVPVSSVSALLPLLDGPVEIGVNDGRNIVIKNDTFSFKSQVIDAKFPDVVRMIPPTFGTQATVSASSLKVAVDQSLVLTFANFVALDISRTDVLVYIDGSESNAESSIECLELTGPPVRFGMNGKMLSDKLGEEGSILIKANDKASPVMLSYMDDDSYKVIIMPMRLER